MSDGSLQYGDEQRPLATCKCADYPTSACLLTRSSLRKHGSQGHSFNADTATHAHRRVMLSYALCWTSLSKEK